MPPAAVPPLVWLAVTLALTPFIEYSFLRKLGLFKANVQVLASPDTYTLFIYTAMNTIPLAAWLFAPSVLAIGSFKHLGPVMSDIPREVKEARVTHLFKWLALLSAAAGALLVIGLWTLGPAHLQFFLYTPVVVAALISTIVRREFLWVLIDTFAVFMVWVMAQLAVTPFLRPFGFWGAIASFATVFAVACLPFVAALFVRPASVRHSPVRDMFVSACIAIVPFLLLFLLHEQARLNRASAAARLQGMLTNKEVLVSTSTLPAGHDRDFSSRPEAGARHTLRPAVLVNFSELVVACKERRPFDGAPVPEKPVLQRCLVVKEQRAIGAVEYETW